MLLSMLAVMVLGPHHESGLVALKTNDPQKVQTAVKFFLEREPQHCIELVRIDRGASVLVLFGSCLRTVNGEYDRNSHVDMHDFQSPNRFALLAKTLGVPVWGGFAIGGYSNAQDAWAFDATGVQRWASHYDFGAPEASRQFVADPFSDEKKRRELLMRARLENGYGRIGAELGFEYLRIIDRDVGDAIYAEEKRDVKNGDVLVHSEWLRGPYKSAESPTALPPPRVPAKMADAAFACGGCGAEGASLLAAALNSLAQHQGQKAGTLSIRLAVEKGDATLRLSGAALGALTETLASQRFMDFVHLLLPEATHVTLFRVSPKPPECLCDANPNFTVVGGCELTLKAPAAARFEPLSVGPTATQRQRIEKARQTVSEKP